jgi:hypothetical protein
MDRDDKAERPHRASRSLKRRTILRRTNPGVVITDPELLASLRLSPEAIAKIERMERASMRPLPRIVIGSSSRPAA